MIVEDESFYLGHLLIIIETFSKSKISNISNMWEDLLETGIEYFKMGNDGESFLLVQSSDKFSRGRVQIIH